MMGLRSDWFISRREQPSWRKKKKIPNSFTIFSRTLELSWSRLLNARGPQARRGATRIVRAQITYCTDARLPTFYHARFIYATHDYMAQRVQWIIWRCPVSIYEYLAISTIAFQIYTVTYKFHHPLLTYLRICDIDFEYLSRASDEEYRKSSICDGEISVDLCALDSFIC